MAGMNFSKTAILTLAILFVVLESDLGHKKVGWFRIARPIIVAGAIVPIYFTNLPTSGNDLLLQGIGALLGIVLGLGVVSPLFVRVEVDPAYKSWWARRRREPGKWAAMTQSGTGYAVVWIVVSLARLAFAYGSQHWFPHALGVFLHDNSLSNVALTNSLIFLPVGMDVFRSVGLLARGSGALRHERLSIEVVPS
jgi:hypothetical protein